MARPGRRHAAARADTRDRDRAHPRRHRGQPRRGAGARPRLAVVSDRNDACGARGRIERALAACATIKPVSFDASRTPTPPPRAACANAPRRDALVAVGSGTINDLCKYAAAQDRKPHVVFATAPSMNGYTSANAAITVDGHKHSLPAATPRGVFIDLEVLAAAPARMIRAGLGDSLCRTTAQADWLLSHQLLGTPYRSAPFALLAADEAMLFDAPDALFGGDLEAMRALARTLVLSGLGMTLCGGSYPASQGEHLISHYLDMFSPRARRVSARRAGRRGDVDDGAAAGGDARGGRAAASGRRRDREELVRRFGDEIGPSCWDEFMHEASRNGAVAAWRARPRFVGRDPLGTRRHRAGRDGSRGPERAGCPATPAAIGVTPEFYARAVRNARFLRDRYTFLDLADDSGRLDRSAPVHVDMARRPRGSRRRSAGRRSWRCCAAKARCGSPRWRAASRSPPRRCAAISTISRKAAR